MSATADHPIEKSANGAAARGRIPPGAVVVALALGATAGGLSWWAAGPTLGLFLGGMLLAAIIVPPLVSGETTSLGQLLVALGAAAGVASVWLVVVLRPHFADQPYPSPSDWLACTSVLFSLALALGGATAFLMRLGVPAPVASFGVLVVAALWLAWPVWLSGALAGHENLVPLLALPHPLVAMNAVLRHMGLWTQQPIAYHLTDLNHDVTLPLPAGVGWAVAAHALPGVALYVGAAALDRRGRRRAGAATASEGDRARSGT